MNLSTTPQTFIAAVQRRYASSPVAPLPPDTPPPPSMPKKKGPPARFARLNTSTTSNSTTTALDNARWELIGSKQVDLSKLRDISVQGEVLQSAGTAGEIRSVCPRVQNLNLRGTGVVDFSLFAAIASELPELQFLDASENMNLGISLAKMPSSAFQHLSVLVLNSTKMLWEHVCEMVPYLPVVREIHLESNDYTSLPISPLPSNSLRLLNLTENGLSSWVDLLPGLQGFPALDTLVLSQNPVRSVTGCECLSRVIPHLSSLSLLHVPFPQDHGCPWTLHSLSRAISSLKSLRISYEPFFGLPMPSTTGKMPPEDDVAPPSDAPAGSFYGSSTVNITHRMTVIAQIPALTSLNGSVIRATERREAEYYTASAAQNQKGNGSSAPQGGSMATVTVTLRGNNPQQSLTVALPLLTKVSQVKALMVAKLGCPAEGGHRLVAGVLSETDPASLVVEVILKEDLEDLLWYQVRSGMVITVEGGERA